jgi:outer membrane lipoprotein-sorting protein
MNCVHCQDQLVTYIEGLVTDQQKTDIENHLKDCVTCQQEEQSLRALQDRLVDRGKALDASQLETDVLSAIIREQKQKLDTTQQANRALSFRRNIMKNPIAKLSIAAAIVVAVTIGMSLWTQTSSIALADVLTQIERVTVYMYQASATWTGEARQQDPFSSDEPATVLVSQELDYAEKTVMTVHDPNSDETDHMEVYILPQQNKVMAINHNDKQYFEFALKEDMIKRQQDKRDARAVVKRILKCQYEHLGEKSIDGVDCEGFSTTDPSYGGGIYGEVRVELWIDTKTYLPVRLETDTQVDEDGRLHTVCDQFQWDVKVDAQEFEPVIPEGYTSPMAGPVQMPAMTEATLIKGLQLLLDMGSPSYPESLTMQAMASSMKSFQEQTTRFMETDDKEAAKAFMLKHYNIDLDQGKPSQDQLTQATIRIFMTVQGACMYYATLVQDQKDPDYHGDLAKPGDAHKVLVRWKVSASEYRVIYGDLRAETVSAERLEELEKTLPQ